jgi:hypothetical protein
VSGRRCSSAWMRFFNWIKRWKKAKQCWISWPMAWGSVSFSCDQRVSRSLNRTFAAQDAAAIMALTLVARFVSGFVRCGIDSAAAAPVSLVFGGGDGQAVASSQASSLNQVRGSPASPSAHAGRRWWWCLIRLQQCARSAPWRRGGRRGRRTYAAPDWGDHG